LDYHANAMATSQESLPAYCMVCFQSMVQLIVATTQVYVAWRHGSIMGKIGYYKFLKSTANVFHIRR